MNIVRILRFFDGNEIEVDADYGDDGNVSGSDDIGEVGACAAVGFSEQLDEVREYLNSCGL